MVTFRGEQFKEETVTLFRPVGPDELKLIKKSGWKKFPPRLPSQPIFYPVVSESYASKIAKDWNVPDSGFGYVLEFYVKKTFLDKYSIQTAGGKSHQEYWIPAEDLDQFNDALLGRIWKIHTYNNWFVYLLKCSDNTLYCGITNDLDKRIATHNAGKGAKYTRGRTPVTLLKSWTFPTKGDALRFEYKVKQLSRDEKLKL
jgi:predicted GIY-YIG superfamily endonuclease